MSKKLTKKSLLFSTVVLSMFAASQVQAEEGATWTARSVEEIRGALVSDGNKTTYTVQYGDTLSAIAEAVGVDVNVLANINKITNIDLIYPGTVLTITYNEQKEVATVKVETPSTSTAEVVTATADLATNQVLVQDRLVQVEDLSAETPVTTKESMVAEVTKSVVEATASQPSYGGTAQPVAEAINRSLSEESSVTLPTTSSVETAATESASLEQLTASIVDATATKTNYAQTEEPVAEAINRVVETSASSAVTEEPVAAPTEVSEGISESVTETQEETTSSETSVEEQVSETSEQMEVPATSETEVSSNETPTPAVPESSEQAPVEVEAPAVESSASEQASAPVEETPVATPAVEVEQVSAETTETPVVETPQEPVEVAPAPVAEQPQVQENRVYNSTGMQPKAAAFQSEVGNTFGISNIGGYRPGDPQDHGKGLAVDVMVDSVAQGNQVAQYAIDNMANNDISYVIWQQQFYAPVNNIYGPANTWNPMPDRGSATQNHMDHVHVSFNE